MSNRLFKIWSALLGVLVAAGLCVGVSSCQPEGITDTSEFTLYYPGITDIGPSTNFSVSPSYHGETPSDFRIYKVTHEGKDFQTDCFTVDASTGEVSLSGTDNLPVGKYALSISCRSNGSEYMFADAITVNMMRPVWLHGLI